MSLKQRLFSLFALLFVAGFTFAMVTGNSISVAPGETKTNGDVTVQNNHNKRKWQNLPPEQQAAEPEGPSSGSARISPDNAIDPTSSDVRLNTGFAGEVRNLDPGDVVNADKNIDATISGTGGAVSLQGGSDVTITNTGDPNDPNAQSITVSYPGGTSSVAPGTTVPYHTN